MSYQTVQWALDDAPMLRTASGKPDTTARAVLVARAERADENGCDSHASVADVIWRTGFDERTVQRAQERLEAAGLMVRDGWTAWGTQRWKLDMSKRRDPAERAEIEAAIERRKEADRERARCRRQNAVHATAGEPRLDSESRHPDAESRPSDSASRRVDSASGCLDATPPEPPLNLPGTTQGTVREPPTGGTLPPDPLRPLDPPSSDLGDDDEDPISSVADHSHGDLGATTYVARDSAEPGPPSLHVIEGNPNATADPSSARTLRPVPDPPAKGFGFCLVCRDEGKPPTLAVDDKNGSVCEYHLRSA